MWLSSVVWPGRHQFYCLECTSQNQHGSCTRTQQRPTRAQKDYLYSPFMFIRMVLALPPGVSTLEFVSGVQNLFSVKHLNYPGSHLNHCVHWPCTRVLCSLCGGHIQGVGWQVGVMMRPLWFGIMTRELLIIARSLSRSPSRRNARGKVWGTDEINVEGWKPLKRLQGHSSG